MDYRCISAVFLLILVLGTLTAADNMTSVDYSHESGVVRVVYIALTIDPSGVVYIKENLIVRRGDLVAVMIPSNVQDLQILDSNETKIKPEIVVNGKEQLVSFILGSGEENKTEETIVIEYNTQQLTDKFGDTWEINYTTTVTPIGPGTTGTVLKLYTPQNTQITKIDFKDFYWSPMGGSEVEIYPLTKNFNLNLYYKLGVSGPLIPRPNGTTTTLPAQGNTTTTTPALVDPSTITWLINQINNIYYLMVFGLILAFLLGLFSLFLRHRRLKTEGKKEEVKENVAAVPIEKTVEKPMDIGAGFSVEAVNTNFEVISLPSEVQGAIIPKIEQKTEIVAIKEGNGEDKEELVDAPNKPLKPSKGHKMMKESVRNVLDETELKVIDMLLKYEDEITQAYIYKTTGIPKSSLSDTIKRLEKRNIIERKREGRINWIKLKEWVFD